MSKRTAKEDPSPPRAVKRRGSNRIVKDEDDEMYDGVKGELIISDDDAEDDDIKDDEEDDDDVKDEEKDEEVKDEGKDDDVKDEEKEHDDKDEAEIKDHEEEDDKEDDESEDERSGHYAPSGVATRVNDAVALQLKIWRRKYTPAMLDEIRIRNMIRSDADWKAVWDAVLPKAPDYVTPTNLNPKYLQKDTEELIESGFGTPDFKEFPWLKDRHHIDPSWTKKLGIGPITPRVPEGPKAIFARVDGALGISSECKYNGQEAEIRFKGACITITFPGTCKRIHWQEVVGHKLWGKRPPPNGSGVVIVAFHALPYGLDRAWAFPFLHVIEVEFAKSANFSRIIQEFSHVETHGLVRFKSFKFWNGETRVKLGDKYHTWVEGICYPFIKVACSHSALVAKQVRELVREDMERIAPTVAFQRWQTKPTEMDDDGVPLVKNIRVRPRDFDGKLVQSLDAEMEGVIASIEGSLEACEASLQKLKTKDAGHQELKTKKALKKSLEEELRVSKKYKDSNGARPQMTIGR